MESIMYERRVDIIDEWYFSEFVMKQMTSLTLQFFLSLHVPMWNKLGCASKLTEDILNNDINLRKLYNVIALYFVPVLCLK
jgi:hypothetical protein